MTLLTFNRMDGLAILNDEADCARAIAELQPLKEALNIAVRYKPIFSRALAMREKAIDSFLCKNRLQRDQVISRTREVALPAEIVRAARKSEADTIFTGIASRDVPVSFGDMDETLSHDSGAIDLSTAASVLFNHDRNAVVGGIDDVFSDGRQLRIKARIDPDAKAASSVSIANFVKRRALRYLSIGYQYSPHACDVSFDEKGRTQVYVRRWRLLEISVTPVALDIGALID